MERLGHEILTEDWGDVQVDITPREYVLDYPAHSFPVQLLRTLHRLGRQSLLPAGSIVTASLARGAARLWRGATA